MFVFVLRLFTTTDPPLPLTTTSPVKPLEIRPWFESPGFVATTGPRAGVVAVGLLVGLLVGPEEVVGVKTVILTELLIDPPSVPVQVSIKVRALVIFSINWYPCRDCVPVQPPVATHEAAFVVDHCSDVLCPEATLVGFADMVIVAVVVAGVVVPTDGT